MPFNALYRPGPLVAATSPGYAAVLPFVVYDPWIIACPPCIAATWHGLRHKLVAMQLWATVLRFSQKRIVQGASYCRDHRAGLLASWRICLLPQGHVGTDGARSDACLDW